MKTVVTQFLSTIFRSCNQASLRNALIVLGLFVLGMPCQAFSRALGQDDVKIVLSEIGWGDAALVDIQKVLESVVAEMSVSFQFRPNTIIRVVHSEIIPQTKCLRGPDGEHRVELSAKGRQWAQFSYQFAHELFHVLSYEGFCVARTGTENLWFEETLGEVSSMFVLRRMAITWRSTPPYPNWKDYAAALEKYSQSLLDDPNAKLSRTSLSEWFRRNEKALRKNPIDREKNRVAAIQLLSLFERNPEQWKTGRYLNFGVPDPSNSFQSYIDNWHYSVPVDSKNFVQDIAAAFKMSITPPEKYGLRRP